MSVGRLHWQPQLVGYSVEIVTRSDGEYALGHRLFIHSPYPVRAIRDDGEFFAVAADVKPDIAFLDILNTDPVMIKALSRVGWQDRDV